MIVDYPVPLFALSFVVMAVSAWFGARVPTRWRAFDENNRDDFGTILASISEKLGKLPGDTVVYTGHGDSTTIGDEIVHYDEWVARGH